MSWLEDNCYHNLATPPAPAAGSRLEPIKTIPDNDYVETVPSHPMQGHLGWLVDCLLSLAGRRTLSQLNSGHAHTYIY